MKVRSGQSLDARGHLKGEESTPIPPLTTEKLRFDRMASQPNGRRLSASGGCVGLSTAIERIFHPRIARILWDEQSADAVVLNVPGREARIDAPHESAATTAGPAAHDNEQKRAASPGPLPGFCAGDNLAAAFGLMHARKKLGGHYWVVVVIERRWLFENLSPEILDNLQNIDSHFLLVMHDDEPAASDAHADHADKTKHERYRAFVSRLTDCGLRVRSPVNGNDDARLAAELEEIERRGTKALLQIDLSDPNPPERIAKSPAVMAREALPGRIGFQQERYLDRPVAAEPRSALADLDEQLIALARRNSQVLLVAETRAAAALRFPLELPEQCREVKSLDPHTLAWCAGAVVGGCHPVVIMPKNKVHRCLDALRRDFCVPQQMATFVVVADEPGSDDSSPQAAFDLSSLQPLPHLTVLTPKNGHELGAMLDYSTRNEGPAVVLLPETFGVPDDGVLDDLPINFEAPEILRNGRDLALLVAGVMSDAAVEAAVQLERVGVSVKVVNLRRAAPLDAAALHGAIRGIGGLLVLEEANLQSGLGDIVVRTLSESGTVLPTRVLQIASPQSGRQNGSHLEAISRIVRDARDLMEHAAGRRERLKKPGGERGPRRKSKESHNGVIESNRFGFTEESLQRELELVQAAELSPDVETWFGIYSRMGHRPKYLWQWCVHGAELTTIPCVLPQWRRHICDTKILSIMLCVLLDDVTDEQGNEQLLEALLQIVQRQSMPEMSGFSAQDRKYAEVTMELSRIYESRVSSYPLYCVYKRLLEFDLLQYFNTMRYSFLLNHNLNLLNVTEHELYLPHAMHMMSFSTLDLMCTPDFQVNELGRYREAIWHAQCMGRVGNLLSTWEREIVQNDFTSGVFAHAVTEGDLSVDNLNRDNAAVIRNAIINGNHEEYFLSRWRRHRELFRQKIAQIKSVDLTNFVESQERFFQMHLACRGAI